MKLVAISAALLTLSIAACDDAGGDASGTGDGAPTSAASGGGGGGASDLPCDVRAIVETHCASCHTDPPRFGAPMPLRTAADFLATGRDGSPIHELVAKRVRDDVVPMPPAPGERLDEAETATLDAWFAAGLPSGECGEGGGSSGGSSGYGGGATLDCDVDVVVEKAAAYTMPSGVEDETKCFGVELSNDGPRRHIVGFGPDVDNDQIVHHFLLFRAPEAQSEEPFDCALFPPEWTLLYAWAPGAPAYELPDEAGFPLEEGETAHLVLQMHYNDYADADDLVDDTRVKLCTTADLRPNDAGVMAFGGVSFTIPAHGDATMACSFEAPEQSGGALPVNVFQSWPHMHKLGRSMKTVVEKKDGTLETLVDVPDFSFASQLLYPTDVKLEGGDRVTTTCGWSNTTGQDVSYGERSADEMCFNIVSYWPAITAAGFTPSLPTAAADCTME